MFDGVKNGEIPNGVESGVREAEGGREREWWSESGEGEGGKEGRGWEDGQKERQGGERWENTEKGTERERERERWWREIEQGREREREKGVILDLLSLAEGGQNSGVTDLEKQIPARRVGVFHVHLGGKLNVLSILRDTCNRDCEWCGKSYLFGVELIPVLTARMLLADVRFAPPPPPPPPPKKRKMKTKHSTPQTLANNKRPWNHIDSPITR